MKRIFVPEVGDMLVGSAYAFKKNAGGTTLKKVAIRIESRWNDYETGIHYQGSIVKDFVGYTEEEKNAASMYERATFSEFDDFMIFDKDTKQSGKHNSDDFYLVDEDDDDFYD